MAIILLSMAQWRNSWEINMSLWNEAIHQISSRREARPKCVKRNRNVYEMKWEAVTETIKLSQWKKIR
jgi:hypothetical protein